MKTRKVIMALILLAVIFGWIYAAVLTAEPSSKASKLCMLGYEARCSFTPISTAICLFAAVFVAFILKRTLTR